LLKLASESERVGLSRMTEARARVSFDFFKSPTRSLQSVTTAAQ